LELYQIALGIGLLMIALEIILPSFIFIGVGVGFLSLVPVYYVDPNIVVGRDAVIFGIATSITFIMCRKIFRKKDDMRKTEKDVNQF